MPCKPQVQCNHAANTATTLKPLLHCRLTISKQKESHQYIRVAVALWIHSGSCVQVGPYDHTVQKPGKGTVLAYWQAEEGLKAADSMKEADQEGGVAGAVGHERHHPARRVDPTGSHPASLEAEADEPSVAPEVKLCSCLQSASGMPCTACRTTTGVMKHYAFSWQACILIRQMHQVYLPIGLPDVNHLLLDSTSLTLVTQ